MNSAVLNVLGLIVTTGAAFLMWRFPPRGAYFTEKGEPVVQWMGSSSEEKTSIGKWQVRLSKLAPFFLTLGFTLQLPAAVVSVLAAR